MIRQPKLRAIPAAKPVASPAVYAPSPNMYLSADLNEKRQRAIRWMREHKGGSIWIVDRLSRPPKWRAVAIEEMEE